MRYGEIAKKIREETRRLNELADELERIESATPKIEKPLEYSNNKILMNTREAAEALGVSKSTVYTLIHRDDFPAVRIGGRTLINVKKLQEWVDNQTTNDF